VHVETRGVNRDGVADFILAVGRVNMARRLVFRGRDLSPLPASLANG
jgi:hypothetical protein